MSGDEENAKEEELSPIETIPDEILMMIFGYVPCMMAIRWSCWRWYNIAQQEYPMKPTLPTLWYHTYYNLNTQDWSDHRSRSITDVDVFESLEDAFEDAAGRLLSYQPFDERYNKYYAYPLEMRKEDKERYGIRIIDGKEMILVIKDESGEAETPHLPAGFILDNQFNPYCGGVRRGLFFNPDKPTNTRMDENYKWYIFHKIDISCSKRARKRKRKEFKEREEKAARKNRFRCRLHHKPFRCLYCKGCERKSRWKERKKQRNNTNPTAPSK